MTPEKIKEYTELLEKYIKESEALPFSATGIILSLHATTELLGLLKSIKLINVYNSEYDHIETAIWHYEHDEESFEKTIGVITLT